MIMPIWIKTQNPYQKLAQHEKLHHRVSNHHSSKSYKLGHFIVLFLYFYNVVVIILGFDLLSKLVYCGVEIEYIIAAYYIMACSIEVIGPKERVRVFRCEFCMCIKDKWAYLWSCKFVQNKLTNYWESYS